MDDVTRLGIIWFKLWGHYVEASFDSVDQPCLNAAAGMTGRRPEGQGAGCGWGEFLPVQRPTVSGLKSAV